MSEHTTNGKPTIVALGATRAERRFNCDFLFVEPTPGATTEHTPIPAGAIRVKYWRSPTEHTTHTIAWRGFPTSPHSSGRARTNVALEELDE